MIREPVTIEPRRAMTPARKRRIHARENGICWLCTKPVDVDGPAVRYDHKVPLELGGPDADENVFPLHTEPCDRIKTAADRRRIDKAKRLNRKQERPRPAGSIRSRGFFKHPTLKRAIGGGVIPRQPKGESSC